MAIDKAAKALVKLDLPTAAREFYDFAHETATKGIQYPNTHGTKLRVLKNVDAFVHGAAAVSAALPLVHLVGDGAAMFYGIVKYAIGKLSQEKVGKGGFLNDVKNSGRLSMTAAGLSILGKVFRIVPGAGRVVSASISTGAHAGATFVSLAHKTRTRDQGADAVGGAKA